jgi:hypothetical protein
MALGCVLLANSRPVEGLFVCVPAIVALFWWAATKWRPGVLMLVRRLTLPIALLVLAGSLMGYYNLRVFGNPLTLPYQVNRATYAVAPVFLWLPPRPEPTYRYRVMRDFFTRWELGDFLYARTVSGFYDRMVQKAGIATFFFFGIALMPPLIMFPRAFRDRRIRYLVLAGVVFVLGLTVNAWFFPHYAAPFVAGIYVILLQAMRHLRVWRPGGQQAGLLLVRAIPVICVASVIMRLSAGPLNLAVDRFPTMWYGTQPLGLPRARVLAQLESYPGRHLAIVRYASSHVPFDDWVYNAADIDRAKVVWAREMDSGSAAPELLNYFHDRHVWLVEPDANPPVVCPYPTAGRER